MTGEPGTTELRWAAACMAWLSGHVVLGVTVARYRLHCPGEPSMIMRAEPADLIDREVPDVAQATWRMI
jgi:hypothetical protein